MAQQVHLCRYCTISDGLVGEGSKETSSVPGQMQLTRDLEGLISRSGGLNDRCSGHGRRKGREIEIDKEHDDGEGKQIREWQMTASEHSEAKKQRFLRCFCAEGQDEGRAVLQPTCKRAMRKFEAIWSENLAIDPAKDGADLGGLEVGTSTCLAFNSRPSISCTYSVSLVSALHSFPLESLFPRPCPSCLVV